MKVTEIVNNTGITEFQLEAKENCILVKDGFAYGKSVTADDVTGWKEIPIEN